MKTALFALPLVALSLFVGCAVDVSEDAPSNEEAFDSAEDDLSAAANLAGVYSGTMSRGVYKLVLNRDKSFFAEIDSGRRCFRAPCDSLDRIEGTFSATSKTLRLNKKASEPASEYYGKYTYSLQSKKLSLTQQSVPLATTSVVMRQNDSYCEAYADCSSQMTGSPTPLCGGISVGGWKCGEQNTCQFACSATRILPPSATTVVVESSPGFGPPPPAGSECRYYEKYTLNVATRELSWKVCDEQTPGGVRKFVTGNKRIEATALGQIQRDADTLKISTQDTCGTDKGVVTMNVTTPNGTAKYMDAFYSCRGPSHVYLSNINVALDALRTAKGE
jgi:hypothetical protein